MKDGLGIGFEECDIKRILRLGKYDARTVVHRLILYEIVYERAVLELTHVNSKYAYRGRPL
jgi:hypothetical protein